tara:strand:+ start:2673 stop:3563 length:891 start_codon:yes stop_codon:yes gene_type:complete
MKYLTIFCFLFVLLIIGCSKDETNLNNYANATLLIESINALAFDQDLEELLSDAFAVPEPSSKKVNEASKGFTKDKFKRSYGDCATITNDEDTNRKTIFFGDNCNDRWKQSRTGTIVITYSEKKDILGSFRQTEFDDFFMNGVKIEGVRRSEITAIDADENKTRKSTLQNGKMIYEDGTFSTKQKSFTYLTVVENDEKQYTKLTGSSSGVSSEGEYFSLTITKPIRYSHTCSLNKRFSKKWKIPVEGVKSIVKGAETMIVDFGDGTCDLTATVTSNGVSETINLFKIKRGHKFKKF